MTIYLDMDGVIADFDKRAIEILGVKPREFEEIHGTDRILWERLYKTNDFYLSLDLMPDALELYEGAKKFGELYCHEVVLLTGIPSKPILTWAAPQKIEWAALKFGEDQKIITCPSIDKYRYCLPGDILIDDWPKYKHLWENVGGHFIVHTDAKSSLKQLEEILQWNVTV